MGRAMADSRSRALALVPVTVEPDEADVAAEVAAELVGEPGLAEVVTLQRRRAAEVSVGDEQSLFVDTLAEYQWARDVAGLAASTLDKLIQPIVEICQYYGVVPWRLTPRQVDRYFAGPGKRGRSTLRQDQPHRRLLRVPRAALRRRDRPPVRGRGGLADRPVQSAPAPRRVRPAGAALSAGTAGVFLALPLFPWVQRLSSVPVSRLIALAGSRRGKVLDGGSGSQRAVPVRERAEGQALLRGAARAVRGRAGQGVPRG